MQDIVKVCSLSFLVAVIVTTGLPPRLIGQESRAEQIPCQLSEIFYAAGWKIPALADLRVEEARRQYEQTESSGLSITVLSPMKQTTVKLRIYYLINGRIEIRDQFVIVRKIYRFDSHGQAFAYGVLYPWASLSNGHVSEAGKLSEVLYYDRDGDGVFETMNQFSGFPFRPVIPDWARDGNSQGAKQRLTITIPNSH